MDTYLVAKGFWIVAIILLVLLGATLVSWNLHTPYIEVPYYPKRVLFLIVLIACFGFFYWSIASMEMDTKVSWQIRHLLLTGIPLIIALLWIWASSYFARAGVFGGYLHTGLKDVERILSWTVVLCLLIGQIHFLMILGRTLMQIFSSK